MKALTICQPYADLICLPDDDDRAKRVENRTWPTSYRGALLIHAGKSRKFLGGDNYGLDVGDMVFGAIVGIARLMDCFQFSGRVPDPILRRHQWLAGHQHVEGPWCFVLTECCPFVTPVPYRGAQGFFEVPSTVVSDQLDAIGV